MMNTPKENKKKKQDEIKNNVPSQNDLEIIYRELDEKNRQLKELDKLKSDFISNVSHELRTPLSIIKEGVNLILDKVPGEINDKQGELLVIVKRNIERLSNIINDLLDMSRIEGGKIELKRGRANINELAASLVAFFEAKSKREGLVLKMDIPEEPINVYIDPEKIKQVFSNLIENAIKFTPSGTITVSVKDKEELVECSVGDTGPGIAEENIPLIFDKFRQIDRQYGPGQRGTGLGLPICKEIVKMHGGKIWTLSEEKKGTIVLFTIPKSILSVCKMGINEKLECVSDKSGKQQIMLIVLKIKNIKGIMDTSGETACVKAVNTVESVVKRFVTRPGDMVATCFPESIFILLPHTGHKGAGIICKRIKDRLKARKVVYGGAEIHLDISFGVAKYPDDGKNAGDLIKAASEKIV